MDDIELLECLIYTEIYKIKYQIELSRREKKDKLNLALCNKLTGLNVSLELLKQIQSLEE
jgi:hypothetical protein